MTKDTPLEKACFEIEVLLHSAPDSQRMRLQNIATTLAMESLHQGYVMGLSAAQKMEFKK